MASNNPNNLTETDLTILPPKRGKGVIKMKRPVNKALFNVERGCLMLLIGLPGAGKTTCILNLLANENFLKHYYETVHFIGATIEFDPTLKPLTEFYGNCHNDLGDATLDAIIKSQLEQDEDTRTNMCLIIDDCLSLPGFSARKDTTLNRLFGIHRHVTRGHLPNEDNNYESGGGGLVILSTQRLWGSTPVNARACADAICIGRTANEEQLGRTAKEYGGMFGGEEQLRQMIDYCFHNEDHGFICLYIAGDMDPDSKGPVAYKNWAEKIFPTDRFPAKEVGLSKAYKEEVENPEDKNISND